MSSYVSYVTYGCVDKAYQRWSVAVGSIDYKRLARRQGKAHKNINWDGTYHMCEKEPRQEEYSSNTSQAYHCDCDNYSTQYANCEHSGAWRSRTRTSTSWQWATTHQPRRAKLSARLWRAHRHWAPLSETLDLERALDYMQQEMRGQHYHHLQMQRQEWLRKMQSFPSACHYVNWQQQGRLTTIQLATGEHTSDTALIDAELTQYWQAQAKPPQEQTIDHIREMAQQVVNGLYHQQQPQPLPPLQPGAFAEAFQNHEEVRQSWTRRMASS